MYVVDVDTDAVRAAGGHKLAEAQGQLELVSKEQPLPLHIPTHAVTAVQAATTVAAAAATSAHSAAVLSSHESSVAAAGGHSGGGDVVVPSVKSAHPVVVIGRWAISPFQCVIDSNTSAVSFVV